MTENNQSGGSQESWDPYKSFDDAVNAEQRAADGVESGPEDSLGTEPVADTGNTVDADADPAATPSTDSDWAPQQAEPAAGPAAEPMGQQSADPYGQPSAQPYGQPSADPYGQPSAQPYGQPYGQPSADPYGQPSAPQYGQQPYGQQAQPYGAPAPYGAGQFGPGQMNPGWNQGPTQAGESTLTLNYWLSVFFSWIPALIFYLTEKDKNALVAEHVKENLNFQITRVIAGLITTIPVIGWIIGGIASLVLFVIAIMGAIRGPEAYRAGQVYKFPFSLPLLK